MYHDRYSIMASTPLIQLISSKVQKTLHPVSDFWMNMPAYATPLPRRRLTLWSGRGGASCSACGWDRRTVTTPQRAEEVGEASEEVEVEGAESHTAAGCRAAPTSRAWRPGCRRCWSGCKGPAATCCRAGAIGSCTWTRHCNCTCLSRTLPR